MTSGTRFSRFAVTVLLMLGAMAYGADSTLETKEAAADQDFAVHNLFQSHMVIQRDKPISVWGWATSGDKITVTLAGKSATAIADKDRRWKAILPAMEASSKPVQMIIEHKGGRVELDDVLIGDVWVAGGQSNMEFGLAAVEDGDLEVASANFPQIRLLSIPKVFGPELKKNFPRAEEFSKVSGRTTTAGDWQICTPETVGGFSAIAYVMARRLHMVTQIPIGVINTSRGGTLVEAWTPEARLRKMDAPRAKEVLARYDERVAAWSPEADLEKQVRKYESRIASMKKEGKKIPASMTPPTKPGKGPMYSHNRPGNCYASVIAPIAGLAVKGAIFHQGYNNCFQGVWGAEMYRVVFPEMIRGWRDAFNDPEMPFGILSQCTAGKVQDLENFLPYLTDIGSRVREAQYQTFLEFYNAGDKNIAFASTYDLRHVSYHPQVKVRAGERAARWALATQYDMEGKFSWLPPVIKEVKAEGGALVLTFDQKVAATSDGSPVEGFAIAGKDGKFQPAYAQFRVIGKKRWSIEYDKTTLLLTHPLVPEPVHFRYAWGRSPMGNILAGGVPLATQRSDNWTNADLLKALTGDVAKTPLALNRGENGKLTEALKREDKRRLLAAAKALLKQEAEAKEKAEAEAKAKKK